VAPGEHAGRNGYTGKPDDTERVALDSALPCVYDTQMTSADLIRDLRRAGWALDRVTGSHHIFKHPGRPGTVVVPHPKKDLGIGLVKSIRQLAGI
jgi:predicted RNA binding protein YcfA (HicA-like mRNA interferase family)